MNAGHKITTSLSPKEIALLRRLVQGATLAKIAQDLDLSEAVVMTNLRTVFKKVEVQNHSQAVAWARQNGIS
jgi:DNA-binding CsgD family transcriptional regulator